MSGICDTCKREHCHAKMDGLRSCDFYHGGETRYDRLFGTPERAARVIVALNNCRVTDCADCWARGACNHYGEGGDYNALLDWLNGDA